MKIARREFTTVEHAPTSRPQIAVEPGEVFLAETELCTGPWLTSPDMVFSPELLAGPNPTVVVEIKGAKPGDALRVHILEIIPEPQGYTGFWEGHALAKKIADVPWKLPNVRIVRIEDGFVRFSDKLSLPIAPMIGTLGTAPASNTYTNAYGGAHGGNMDAQDVRPGAVVTLPVEVEGAMLHIGDVHAIQGDGEICGAGGIECASTVKLMVEVVKRPQGMRAVRVEDETHIGAISCEATLEDSFYRATEEVLMWMVNEYGFEKEEAYLLCAQVMEARIPQMVNPTRTIVAKVPKKYLQPGTHAV